VISAKPNEPSTTGRPVSARPITSPAAARRRRYRARQRCGKRVLIIEVDAFELIETLIEARYVTEAESVDRRAIEAATSRVLSDWCRHWRETNGN
jgi:hypothetical protein